MTPAARPGVVILISGRGSNMQAIIAAANAGQLTADIRAVISNNPDAPGLAHARAAGIATQVVDHRRFKTREEFDEALRAQIDVYQPRLLVLAGFMRLLGKKFIAHYTDRILNIHPALLPNFPGLNTHARALQSGLSHHGASVHFVTSDMDQGPIIIQAAVPIEPDDTVESLSARVLKEEHRIYPLAIGWFLDGRLSIHNGRVLLDGQVRPEQNLPASATESPESNRSQ